MQNRNMYDNLNTFNFSRNSSSNSLADKLNHIKQFLTVQRNTYTSDVDLLLCVIDECIQTTASIDTTPMTNDEIIQYTASRSYGDISNPLNSICPLSRIRFTNAMIVCRLPCGHLFDGPTICFRLSQVNSLCPTCSQNVRLLPMPMSNRSNRINETLNMFSTQSQTQRQAQAQAQPPPPVSPPVSTQHSTPHSYPTQPNSSSARQHSQQRYTQQPAYRYTYQTPLTSSIHDDPLVSIISSIFGNLSDNVSFNVDDIGLSDQRINECTEIIKYSTVVNPSNYHCPISYVDFNDDTMVCQIKECKHIFDSESLKRWFASHTTCPVCRHELREPSPTYDMSMNSATRNYSHRFHYTFN